MAKEMLINVSEGEECRIALLEDGRLDELYMERTSSTSHVGNIYKGRVTNVEPSIQAAFVDFGLGRNGFLHISDLMPTYFGRKGEDIQESVGRKMARRDRPPIQRCLRRGDEIIVQIIKEGIGTKGPTLSTYLSIPGRILVMMPGMGKMGVSKKIEDEVERRRLRQILDQLKPPKDCGFIIRTNGIGKTKAEIERDLKYLTRLWEQIDKKQSSERGPVELYTEGDLVTRTVRDVFATDVDRIVVDNKEVAKRVKEVIKLTSPRTKNKVETYEEPVPLFHKYKIEHEIEQIYSRHVPLPSGGSLVIDSTEAIVAIDVNSGKFRDHSDAEMTAFKTDLEAADEIPRQLKLRDLGGVIICDFIDLRYERHRREVEQRLHDNLKNDRAKTKMLRMSQFGIIEMTRQRMRPSLKRSIYFDCPHCKGAGLVKTPESMSLDVMRRLAIAANDLRVVRIELAISPDVGMYLLNKKRAALARLEADVGKRIIVRQDISLGLDEMRLDLFDARDGMVVLEELGMLAQPPHVTQLGTRPPQQGRGRFDQRRQQHQQRRQPPSQPISADRFDMEEAEDALDEAETHEQREGRDERAARDDRGSRDRRDQRDQRDQRGAGREDQRHRQPSRDQRDRDRQDEASDVVEVDAEGSAEVGERPEGEWDPQGVGGGGRRRRRRRRRRGRGGNGNGNGHGNGAPPQQQQRGPGEARPSYASDDSTDEEAIAEAHDAAIESESSDSDLDVAQDRSAGQGQTGETGAPGEGRPRRRRRRRGGRRHKKRHGAAQGQPVAAGQESADRPIDSVGEGDEFAPEETESEILDAAPEAMPTRDESDVEMTDEEPSTTIDEAPAPVEEPAAPVEAEPAAAEPVAEPQDAPRPKRRRSKSASGTGTSTRKPRASRAKKQPIATTKSADKHLVDDEVPQPAEEEIVPDPVEPQPVYRPRSYRDLDAIPDDYDE